MAKKEFKWDTEELLNTIFESNKVKHEVYKCSLKGQAYVVVVSWSLTAEGWKISKNRTFKKSLFDQVADAVVGSDIW